MMRSNQSQRRENRVELRKPSLVPTNLHFFLQDFETFAFAEYEDAGIYAFKALKPDYDAEFEPYVKKKLGLTTQRQFATLDADQASLERKRWFKLRSDYDDKMKKMFNEMFLHISDSSMNLIKSFKDDLDACKAARDPNLLIKLIKKSHTQAGQQATREEKEAKKDRLKNLRQG